MKLNNKGFTVVELLASFSLMMVVTIFLFEVVMELKNIYVSSSLETTVKNENALIARAINEQLADGVQVKNCGGTTCHLTNGDIVVDPASNIIIVGNRTFMMPNDTSISAENPFENSCSNGSCFLAIHYNVVSSDFRDGIPFNLVLNY